MMKSARILAVSALACAGASGALAQSKEDIAGKIGSALPDNARGQITASGLRGVLNSMNGARGQPGGIAELTSEGRLADAQAPRNLTEPNLLGISSAQAFRLTGVGPLDDKFHATVNPNAIQFSPGMGVAYCPGLACIPAEGTDRNQRASMVISGESQLDAEAEEQLLGLSLTSKTGKTLNWTANTNYKKGDNVHNPAFDNVFRVLSDCVSGASGPLLPDQSKPKGVIVQNGSCQLQWINRGAIAAKLTAYFENEAMPGTGNTWVQANNTYLRPGVVPNLHINTEFDFSNGSGNDCQLGNYCVAVRIGMGGPNKSTTGLDISSDQSPGFKTIWGMRLEGKNLASSQLIGLDSSSDVGIGTNLLNLTNPVFDTAFVQDNSKGGNTSYQNLSAKAQAVFDDGGAAPYSLQLRGGYSSAAISTLAATISPQAGAPTAFVMAEGQQTCMAGFNVCRRYNPAAQRIEEVWSNVLLYNIDSTGNFRLGGYVTPAATVVANLPVCNAGTAFAIMGVTDAVAGSVTYRGAPTGGGTSRELVMCNGTSWTYH